MVEEVRKCINQATFGENPLLHYREVKLDQSLLMLNMLFTTSLLKVRREAGIRMLLHCEQKFHNG